MARCVRHLALPLLANPGIMRYRLDAMHATPKRLNTRGLETGVAPNAEAP
jgi:hypothetical protein